MGSSSDNSTISSVHMGSYPMDQTDHYATNSLDRVGYAHRSANKPPCPNCHQVSGFLISFFHSKRLKEVARDATWA